MTISSVARSLAGMTAILFCIAAEMPCDVSTAEAANYADLMDTSPQSQPWVYWFWKNGNISREGITADLEAMDRVGIRGVIVMEVSLSVPKGPITFFSDEWRALFAFAVAEADRLGMQVCINSAPGWTGSGGPWITPEKSMKKVVFAAKEVSGPGHFNEVLPQPETLCEFYRDITVLAFPTPEPGAAIADIEEKALYRRNPFSSMPGVRPHFEGVAEYETVSPDQAIPLDQIRDISAEMDASGKLAWTIPEGKWTILRVGYTSTGQTNRPAPLPGLECDKLDASALEEHFDAYIRKIVEDAGEHAGKSLVATHFDSWEVGGQNWTDHFREEFKARRGYDLLPYLPAMHGRVVESLEVSERFLWDLRQTVSEMIAEYHGKKMRDLAQSCGLYLSIEPYDMTPCDDMTLGAAGDVPMCEFWSDTFDTRYSVREMASVAHVYGRPILAAEAFTSIDKWLLYPGAIKTNGDWAFCEGVNKMVIHRYIHQPFSQARPGLSLGPHGLHYERTQTWWEYSRPWHEYLARCQSALRNPVVADVLYLSPEGAPNVFQGPDPAPAGYKYDACTPEALLTRVRCEEGDLVSGGDARYRMLVLPDRETMTPEVLQKLDSLVRDGATLVGPPPLEAPGLSGYPECDGKVRELAAALWSGERKPDMRHENAVGKGQVIWGGDLNTAGVDAAVENILEKSSWIWCAQDGSALAAPPGRRYFTKTFDLEDITVLSKAVLWITADNAFRAWVNGKLAGRGDNFTLVNQLEVTGLVHEGKNLIAVEVENGDVTPNPAGLVAVLVLADTSGREQRLPADATWKSAPDKESRWNLETRVSEPWENASVVGPMGMAPWNMIQVKQPRLPLYPPSSAVEDLLKDRGVLPDFESTEPLRFIHRKAPQGDLYFVSNGESRKVTTDCIFRIADGRPLLLHPEDGSCRVLTEFSITADGRTRLPLQLEPGESYFILFPAEPSGLPEARSTVNFPESHDVLEIAGPWEVAFDPAQGGPKNPEKFEQLVDWSLHQSPDIQHYSGTAVYSCDFNLSEKQATAEAGLLLDLGQVAVVASVVLNGKPAGIAWKAPYRVSLSGTVQPGINHLEIRVANLWINRMIGDDLLPPDSDRKPDGTLKSWPKWLLEGKASPTGRISFATWRHWTGEDPLQPSGLLGPVKIMER